MKFLVILFIASTSFAEESLSGQRRTRDYLSFEPNLDSLGLFDTKTYNFDLPQWQTPDLDFKYKEPEINVEPKFELPKFDFKFEKPKYNFDFKLDEPKIEFDRPEFRYEQPEIERKSFDLDLKVPKPDIDWSSLLRTPEPKFNFDFKKPEIKFDTSKFHFGKTDFSWNKPRHEEEKEEPKLRFNFRESEYEEEEESEKKSHSRDQPRFKINLGEPDYDYREPKIRVTYDDDFQPKLEYVKPKIEVRYKDAKVEHIRRPFEFSLRDLGISNFRRRE